VLWKRVPCRPTGRLSVTSVLFGSYVQCPLFLLASDMLDDEGWVCMNWVPVVASLVLIASLSLFLFGVCWFRNSEELVGNGWFARTWL
jgi:hypothetical protein